MAYTVPEELQECIDAHVIVCVQSRLRGGRKRYIPSSHADFSTPDPGSSISRHAGSVWKLTAFIGHKKQYVTFPGSQQGVVLCGDIPVARCPADLGEQDVGGAVRHGSA